MSNLKKELTFIGHKLYARHVYICNNILLCFFPYNNSVIYPSLKRGLIFIKITVSQNFIYIISYGNHWYGIITLRWCKWGSERWSTSNKVTQLSGKVLPDCELWNVVQKYVFFSLHHAFSCLSGITLHTYHLKDIETISRNYTERGFCRIPLLPENNWELLGSYLFLKQLLKLWNIGAVTFYLTSTTPARLSVVKCANESCSGCQVAEADRPGFMILT